MTVLNTGRFAGSGVGNAPKRHAGECVGGVPKRRSATTCNLTNSAPIGTPCDEKNIHTQQQYPMRFANLTQRAVVLAAIDLNQFFKKGKDSYENQNERESRRHQWGSSCRRLKPGNKHLFS
jgi:hypothetical protein